MTRVERVCSVTAGVLYIGRAESTNVTLRLGEETWLNKIPIDHNKNVTNWRYQVVVTILSQGSLCQM